MPYLLEGVHFSINVTRAILESLVVDLIKKTEIPCQQAIKESKVSTTEIDEVLLVGGMTRMPLVRTHVERIFGKKPSAGVNPDEAVAAGAAIQGAIIKGSVKDLVLLDVTPLNLGLETEGGIMSVMIGKNTTIPTKKSQIFTTAANNQTIVTIQVYQGDRMMAKDNKLLNTFNLTGIPPAERGVPQIEVTFEIDANGILSVSAKENKTGKSASITISNAQGLSKEQVEEMRKEAEKHKEEDEARMRKVELTNNLQSLVFNSKKVLESSKQVIENNSDVKNASEELNNEVNKAEEILNKEEKTEEELKEIHESLNNSLTKFGNIVHQGQPQQPEQQQNNDTENTQAPEQEQNSGE